MAVEEILNETIQQIPVLADSVQAVQGIVSVLRYIVGGIFGLYLALVVLRWYQGRKMTKILERIERSQTSQQHAEEEMTHLLHDIRDDIHELKEQSKPKKAKKRKK